MGTAKDLPAPLPGLGHRYMIITEKMGCAGYRWATGVNMDEEQMHK